MSHAAAPDDPLIGARLARRYRVDALLGRGGMCAVYRGEDEREERPVAIKVLPAAQAADAEMARRFAREIASGKRIHHPNVCAISDSGELADGGKFLVMELLDGRPLDELARAGRVPVARAIAIARQILDGLGAAHQLGIAHRDVKPENVILLGDDTVKLVDFGIASNERAAEKLTAAGVAFGTPEYLSPEMAIGLATDARSDLYSVGVVLFQLVTGRLPFPYRDFKQLLQAHANEAAPSASATAPDARIPPALDAAIARALEKLPEKRFASAQAMADALGEIARAARAQRRRRTVGVVVALALALAAAGAAALLWQPPATEKPAAPAPKRGKKAK